MSRTRLASGEIRIHLVVMSDELEIANSQLKILMHYFCFLSKILFLPFKHIAGNPDSEMMQTRIFMSSPMKLHFVQVLACRNTERRW